MRQALRGVGVVGLAAALAMAGAAWAGEVHPGETRGLGLWGPDIPQVLKLAASDPYRQPAAPACQSIPAEILELDAVLGPDKQKDRPELVRMAEGAVRGMIPYRGVVRFLTGAGKKDHELLRAAMAGNARRGFLRGMEAELSCAPEPPTLMVAAMVPKAPAAESAATPAAAIVAVADEAHPVHIDLATVMLQDPQP
jgi:hypothetical protein